MGKGDKGELSERVPGVSLAWNNVSYTVETKIKKVVGTKTILSDVSGSLEPGKLLALMGPSGSGKTSMLNALAGRVPLSSPNDKLTGSITVNGKAQSDMHHLSAYVMQDDNLFAYSTVNETLMFAASLRLPSSMSLEDKQRHVDTVIGKLGLTPARDVNIGNAKVRGVSGGERKRVTIGVELLHDPPLVFLDEPTSGLDSFQAQSVMETLRNLASNGHTVVCSIHQPRSSIYAMVDSLMLLSQGRCAYYGPSGASCHSYFASLEQPVPEDFNPADHLLDVISVDYRTSEQEGVSKARVDKIVQSWQQSGGSLSLEDAPSGDSKKQLQDEESHAMVSVELTEAYAEAHGGSGASCCTAFPLLLTRTWRELTRNKVELALQIFMNMFFSALFGVIYLRMPFSQKSIMDRTGLLFFQAMNGAFGSAINTSTAIPTQLQVVQRERTAGMYTIFPFCESHTHTHTHTHTQPDRQGRTAGERSCCRALPLHCMALT
jgi:ABC-type multidrug transport system ATPase subunit